MDWTVLSTAYMKLLVIIVGLKLLSFISFIGFLTGGHVLRLFHGHMDECLAIPPPDQGEDQRK